MVLGNHGKSQHGGGKGAVRFSPSLQAGLERRRGEGGGGGGRGLGGEGPGQRGGCRAGGGGGGGSGGGGGHRREGRDWGRRQELGCGISDEDWGEGESALRWRRRMERGRGGRAGGRGGKEAATGSSPSCRITGVPGEVPGQGGVWREGEAKEGGTGGGVERRVERRAGSTERTSPPRCTPSTVALAVDRRPDL